MQIIGFLNRKGQHPDIDILNESGFKSIINDGNFIFFSKPKGAKESLLYYSQGDVHLIFVGYVTNGYERTTDKPDNISNSIIDNYFLRGVKCFDDLDGSYIIILWDRNKETLYINRDTYGTKLLYYFFSDKKGLVFSNDLNILLSITGQKNISHKALHEYLRCLYISPPYSIYEDIYLLEPEKILVITGKEIKLENISTQPLKKHYKRPSLKDAVKEFKNLLCDGIDNKIKDAERAGVFLSGGIDSTLVCAVAAKIKNNIKAYTVGFESPSYDESAVAKNITNYLGIEHKVFKFTVEEDYNAFNDFVSLIPSPFADPAVIPTFQCFKHVSESVDIVLDGTGADSLIGIMPARHIRFILEYSQHMSYSLRMFLTALLKINKTLSAYSPLFDFKEAVELLIVWKGWTKEEISLLCDESDDLSHIRFYKVFTENYKKDPYELYSMLIASISDDRQHQIAPIFGLDIAFPFWDRKVQEFVKKLPLEYKYNNGTSKILFRELLGELIPSYIWDKPKQGFNYPFERLLKYNDYELPKTYLSKDAVNEHGLFNPSVADGYLQRFLKGDETVRFKIWALVIFQAWYFNYNKSLHAESYKAQYRDSYPFFKDKLLPGLKRK